MKRAMTVLTVLSAAALTLMLFGCPTDNGPDRDGSLTSGVILNVTSLSAGDGENGDMWTIDVVQDVCAVNGTTITLEVFYDATFDVTLKTYDPSHQTTGLTGVMIESYDVVFTTQYAGQPALTPIYNVGVQRYMPPGTTLTVNGWMLMPVYTKNEFITNGGDPTSPFSIYKCTITFHGENDYGKEVKATGVLFVLLNDYNNC